MAASAVQGWLHQDHRPLGSALSSKIKGTQAVNDAAGNALYYVVQLDPSGFVILPADDLADPIVVFSATGSFDASSKGPLATMVTRDLPQRLARARARAAGQGAGASPARNKWRGLLSGSPNPPPDSEENGNIVVVSQIWVSPFVQTLWNQESDVSLNEACYNYFTPPYASGTVTNDPCGCVATCLAQVMYYFQYPNTGVGTGSYSIKNNTTNQTVSLRGGDGAGGVYEWSQMPPSPNGPTTNQAGAIGNLTHDAGAAVHMAYTPSDSEAANTAIPQALTSTFLFKNAAYYENDSSGLSGTSLLNMINPNIDARLPVMFAIEPDGGHCVLCDGYGYSSSTLFHHLNMGWGGDDNVWYALPDIDTADNGGFTTIVACVYNIYTNSSSGQIISGRVTDLTGAPVAGATVTATRIAGGTYTATTDTNGIYALARIPPSSEYDFTVTDGGGNEATGNYSTGNSIYDALPSGNIWGANFVLSPRLLAIPETGFASIGPVGGPFSVASQTYILTNTAATSISWKLSNTNTWLSVSSTSGILMGGASITNLTVSLNATATNFAAGTQAGSIWITNVSNGIVQQLQFSLTVKSADYPIAVSGFNLDVVVENIAVGGNTVNYADVFDPACAYLQPSPPPVCFYEAGLTAIDYLGGTAVLGLPQSGVFTSLVDQATTFQFAPYNSSNVLYLTSSAPTGSLTLNTPAAYKSLSVLAGSAQGGGNGKLVLNFADGTSSSAIPFNATNYMTTNTPSAGAAITNFGLLITGAYNEFGSVDYYYFYPTLYQTTINLQSLSYYAKAISSVTFTMPSGTGTTASTGTGIFALSGTESSVTNPLVSFVTNAGAMILSGGTFTMELTNLTGQGQVIISASTNLLQWVPIYTNPSTYGGIISFTDSNATAFAHRFYRATTP